MSSRDATIKAIETRYKGYRFRSRLEARWAVFFDALGIAWEYEREGFRLLSGPYLPDFWLPQVAMFAEVKPEAFSPVELTRCLHLHTHTRKPVLLLDGLPSARMYFAIEDLEYNHGAYDVILGEYDIQEIHGYWLTEQRFYRQRHGPDCFGGSDYEYPAISEPLSRSGQSCEGDDGSIERAKSARFEHGESG